MGRGFQWFYIQLKGRNSWKLSREPLDLGTSSPQLSTLTSAYGRLLVSVFWLSMVRITSWPEITWPNTTWILHAERRDQISMLYSGLGLEYLQTSLHCYINLSLSHTHTHPYPSRWGVGFVVLWSGTQNSEAECKYKSNKHKNND